MTEANRRNGKTVTRARMNRIIKGQIRRAVMTPQEKTVRRALLRLRQGSVNLAQIQGVQ